MPDTNPPSESVDRPNVVFVLADDLGWGDLGCYGHPHINTPNIDQLADEGSLFTSFYANSGVCSPSRAALMTGQYPARLGIHGHFAPADTNDRRGMPQYLDPNEETVTRCLQEEGYATAHFGKWHLGHHEEAPIPSAYGIDDHRTHSSNATGEHTWEDHGRGEEQPYYRARSTELIVDEAIRFIREHRDRPFYINLWTLLPHAILHPTETQMEPYAEFGPSAPDSSTFPYKGAMQIYYASVTEIDRQVGRLLDALEALDVADETLVAFSSDNGPEDLYVGNASHSAAGTPGPFRGRKRSLYEGGLRMPFVVRWPGRVPEGRVDDSVLAGVDWLPTLCGLVGRDPPSGVDGEDRSAALLGDPSPRSSPLLWEWRFHVYGSPINTSPMLAIRDGKWKLLMNPDRSRVELYDLPSDPMELDNVAEEHPEVREDLVRQLREWRQTLPDGPVSEHAGRNEYPWPGSSVDYSYLTPGSALKDPESVFGESDGPDGDSPP